MIAVIQVSDGVSMNIDDELYNQANGKTLLVLLGVKHDDDYTDCDYIIKKLPKLRIFDDDESKMNLSAYDVSANIFIVSQFTLFAKCKKGNRPSFDLSAKYDEGKKLYEYVIEGLKKTGLNIYTGVFGAKMDIQFNNNGPVTIILDSRE